MDRLDADRGFTTAEALGSWRADGSRTPKGNEAERAWRASERALTRRQYRRLLLGVLMCAIALGFGGAAAVSARAWGWAMVVGLGAALIAAAVGPTWRQVSIDAGERRMAHTVRDARMRQWAMLTDEERAHTDRNRTRFLAVGDAVVDGAIVAVKATGTLARWTSRLNGIGGR